MLKRTAIVIFVATLAAAGATARGQQQPAPRRVAIRCGRLIDGRSDRAVENAVVLVEGERITAVGPNLTVPAGYEVVDLGHETVLPGLIDNHTHILLQGDV